MLHLRTVILQSCKATARYCKKYWNLAELYSNITGRITNGRDVFVQGDRDVFMREDMDVVLLEDRAAFVRGGTV